MSRVKIRSRASLRVVCCVGAMSSAVAQAQTADPKATVDELTEVVVTGTLLRGTAPVGANLIEVSRDSVAQTGVASTNDLLATIPQISISIRFHAVSAPASVSRYRRQISGDWAPPAARQRSCWSMATVSSARRSCRPTQTLRSSRPA